MTDRSGLDVRGLRKSYRNREIVKDFGLTLDAGEVVGDFGKRQPALADSRIKDRDLRLADLGQHDEMVQVPVQDARQFQLAQILHVQPQRPGRESQLLGDLDQVAELGALERQREPAAHLRQADAHPVRIGHHGQGSEAALGGLGLNDRLHALLRRENRDAP